MNEQFDAAPELLKCETGATAASAPNRRRPPPLRMPRPPLDSAAGGAGLSPSGDPFGVLHSLSTPLTQPFDGHEGHGGRDASSPATVVITKEA